MSPNNFALSDAEDNTSGPLNRWGIGELPLLNIDNSPKVPRAKFLGTDELFCFISICKFDGFKNPFATITSLSELYFRWRLLNVFCTFNQKISSVGTNEKKELNCHTVFPLISTPRAYWILRLLGAMFMRRDLFQS